MKAASVGCAFMLSGFRSPVLRNHQHPVRDLDAHAVSRNSGTFVSLDEPER